MKPPGHTAPGRPRSQKTPQNPAAQRRKYPRPTYHRIKCNVCRHPDHAAIDEAFLRWESPEKLARMYAIADHSSIYRHVHATGLYARRRRSLASSLEFIIHQGVRVVPTAMGLVRAVELYSQLDDHGEHIQQPKPRFIQCVATTALETSPFTSKINRQPARLENDATC
jgi:hypothetical protein